LDGGKKIDLDQGDDNDRRVEDGMLREGTCVMYVLLAGVIRQLVEKGMGYEKCIKAGSMGDECLALIGRPEKDLISIVNLSTQFLEGHKQKDSSRMLWVLLFL